MFHRFGFYYLPSETCINEDCVCGIIEIPRPHTMASNAAWESSPEYIAWKAKQQVVAESKSASDSAQSGSAAPGDTKKSRRKRQAKTEAVVVAGEGAKPAKKPRAKKQQVVASATGDETQKKNMGAARKIREKGKKDNALDKIPSSNKPPKTDAENAVAQEQIRVFSDMLMRSL